MIYGYIKRKEGSKYRFLLLIFCLMGFIDIYSSMAEREVYSLIFDAIKNQSIELKNMKKSYEILKTSK